MDDNKFSTFPEILFRLPLLQYVQLSGNRLFSLPDFTGYWEFLEELYLDKCQLRVHL